MLAGVFLLGWLMGRGQRPEPPAMVAPVPVGARDASADASTTYARPDFDELPFDQWGRARGSRLTKGQ